ncbi:hypothetical protein EW145_g671 [Phellinidium pouzarii]|uniref:N-acetylglucosaminylphosphatidylinositol deacetylase n=1 Tax=Phellinidium pouzarii TaxID=167371 RepID=A0A4S4LJC3_9AGAM|nr:hypothetical protein EW145_g671 [Phellinidium pouzarii]
MFFAPTLLALTQVLQSQIHKLQESRAEADIRRPVDVYTLCLSSGDADGLGNTRKHELEDSLDVMGVEQGKRWVLDEPFKDNITMFWDAGLIAEHVRPYVLEHNIDIILTYDKYGISSHPNHISLTRGVQALLTNSPRNNLRAFGLKTTSLIPKYTGAGAALIAKLEHAFCASPPFHVHPHAQLIQILEVLLSALRALRITDCSATDAEKLVFVSGWAEYSRALLAMRQHSSQLVWFRWLYVTFSRYMWVNSWDEIVV